MLDSKYHSKFWRNQRVEIAPWHFYDYGHGSHDGTVVSAAEEAGKIEVKRDFDGKTAWYVKGDLWRLDMVEPRDHNSERGFIHPLDQGRYAYGWRDENHDFSLLWTGDDPLSGMIWR